MGSITSKINRRVLAAREGGNVLRCHTVPHHGQYSVGKHSYDALSLLLLLHPNPSMNLVKATLWHDCAERFVGDIPAPAKWTNSELGKVYEEAERRVLATLGLLPCLLPDEEDWLKAVDTLELWLWCREEEALGNEAVTAMRRACEAVTEKRQMEGSLPAIAAQLHAALRDVPQKRLSDFFGEVSDYLLTEEGNE